MSNRYRVILDTYDYDPNAKAPEEMKVASDKHELIAQIRKKSHGLSIAITEEGDELSEIRLFNNNPSIGSEEEVCVHRFAKKHPDKLFVLHFKHESDDTDQWKHYFRGHRRQVSQAELIFEPFDNIYFLLTTQLPTKQ